MRITNAKNAGFYVSYELFVFFITGLTEWEENRIAGLGRSHTYQISYLTRRGLLPVSGRLLGRSLLPPRLLV